MANGKRQSTDGKWHKRREQRKQMANSDWQMANVERRMANDDRRKRTANGERRAGQKSDSCFPLRNQAEGGEERDRRSITDSNV